MAACIISGVVNIRYFFIDNYMKTEKTRTNYLDKLAGIFILYMLFQHCLSQTDGYGVFSDVLGRLLGFYMCWFFFKSGMFFRPDGLLMSSVKRLLKPWAIYASLAFVLNLLYVTLLKGNIGGYCLDTIHELYNNGCLYFDQPLWYLISIFIVRLIFSCIWNLGRNALFVACFISLFLASKTEGMTAQYSHYVINIWLGLFFYTCGYLLRDVQYGKLIFCACLIFYAWNLFSPSSINFRFNSLSIGYYCLAVFSGLGGIIVFNNVFKYLEEHTLCTRISNTQLNAFTAKMGGNNQYWC